MLNLEKDVSCISSNSSALFVVEVAILICSNECL